MGRQIQFYMLEEDCREFFDFLRKRDPVIVTLWNSESPELREIKSPWEHRGTLCLWNQALIESLNYKYITTSPEPYYRIDSALPTLEFSPSVTTDWNNRQALLQGRIWTSFDSKDQSYKRWFNAVVRWIRKNYIKNPADLGGYLAPRALRWFQSGGTLLPSFRPVLSDAWLSWLAEHDKARG